MGIVFGVPKPEGTVVPTTRCTSEGLLVRPGGFEPPLTWFLRPADMPILLWAHEEASERVELSTVALQATS